MLLTFPIHLLFRHFGSGCVSLKLESMAIWRYCAYIQSHCLHIFYKRHTWSNLVMILTWDRKSFLGKGCVWAVKRLLIPSWWHVWGHDGVCRSRERFRDILLHSRPVKAAKGLSKKVSRSAVWSAWRHCHLVVRGVCRARCWPAWMCTVRKTRQRTETLPPAHSHCEPEVRPLPRKICMITKGQLQHIIKLYQLGKAAFSSSNPLASFTQFNSSSIIFKSLYKLHYNLERLWTTLLAAFFLVLQQRQVVKVAEISH